MSFLPCLARPPGVRQQLQVCGPPTPRCRRRTSRYSCADQLRAALFCAPRRPCQATNTQGLAIFCLCWPCIPSTVGAQDRSVILRLQSHTRPAAAEACTEPAWKNRPRDYDNRPRQSLRAFAAGSTGSTGELRLVRVGKGRARYKTRCAYASPLSPQLHSRLLIRLSLVAVSATFPVPLLPVPTPSPPCYILLLSVLCPGRSHSLHRLPLLLDPPHLP